MIAAASLEFLTRRPYVLVLDKFGEQKANDMEQKDFRLGWDALNSFCSFFKIEQQMAINRQLVRI